MAGLINLLSWLLLKEGQLQPLCCDNKEVIAYCQLYPLKALCPRVVDNSSRSRSEQRLQLSFLSILLVSVEQRHTVCMWVCMWNQIAVYSVKYMYHVINIISINGQKIMLVSLVDGRK